MTRADRQQVGNATASGVGPRAALAVGCVLLIEALGGAALWLVTDSLSKSDIGIGGLILRGNGALIVPMVGGPALLLVGAALFQVVGRGRPPWRPIGLLAVPLALAGGWLVAGLAAPAWMTAQTPGRSGHTATLLTDGRVLVAGGMGSLPGLSSGVVHATAEVYDPTTGAWAPTGRMEVPRADHVAVRLPTGQVLVLGGTGPEATPWAELYDPSTGSWAVAPSPTTKPTALNSRATPLTDGTVLLVAARPAAAPPTVAERYDPATGAWVPTGSPASIWIVDSDAGPALLPNGRVLLVGLAAPGRRESAAEVYDPASGTWSATDPPPLEWPVVALVPMADGRVLALGAAVHGGVSAAALYDATTGGWSATASPAAGRYDYQAIRLADARVLVAGGNTLEETRSGPLGMATPSAEVYEPTTATWSAAGSMETGRVGHTLTLLADGTVLAAGGSTRAGPLASAEVYDPRTDTWAATGSMNAR